MKRFTILFIIGTLTMCKGQSMKTTGLELVYEYINVGLSEKRKVTLIVRNQESITTISSKDSLVTGSEKEFDVSGDDAIGKQVYKNTQTGEVTFRDFVPEDGRFNACIVTDPMKPMSWTFSAETRKIGKYQCRAAVTEFRGRKYIAYYSDEIPVTHGPWKFSGLPGAAVEIYSMDRNISFSLNRVMSSTAEVMKPSDGKMVTMAYYATRHEKALDEFIDHLRSKLPRGAQMTVNAAGDYNLETDFSDVKR